MESGGGFEGQGVGFSGKTKNIFSDRSPADQATPWLGPPACVLGRVCGRVGWLGGAHGRSGRRGASQAEEGQRPLSFLCGGVLAYVRGAGCNRRLLQHGATRCDGGGGGESGWMQVGGRVKVHVFLGGDMGGAVTYDRWRSEKRFSRTLGGVGRNRSLAHAGAWCGAVRCGAVACPAAGFVPRPSGGAPDDIRGC